MPHSERRRAWNLNDVVWIQNAVAHFCTKKGFSRERVDVSSRSVTAYTLGDAARICGVRPARLRYWERTALLDPRFAAEPRPAFGFRDLVSVRSVLGLLQQGVPLRRIRRSVEAVRERIPELDRPLEALRCVVAGRVVVRHDGVLIESDGQLLLDFGAAAGRPVSPLSQPTGHGVLQIAEEWFDVGCRLDTDRATWGEAAEAYRRALEADPEFADAHCNLGSVYFNQERPSLARSCFERALEIAPDHVEANLNLAALLEEEGRNESALRHYKVALEADPMCADAHVSLALLYEKLGLRRTARSHWRRYVALDPGGTWMEIARNRLEDG